MSTMTYEQACAQAKQLHGQGVPFKKIEEHLKTAGYLSERTKKPVKEMTVRQMVSKEHEKAKTEADLRFKEDRIMLSSNQLSLQDNIQVILGIREFDAPTKIRMIEALLTPSHKPAGESSGKPSERSGAKGT